MTCAAARIGVVRLVRLALALGGACAFASGCAKLPKEAAGLALTSPQMSPGSVVLDIFFVSVPAADRAELGPLWDAIDEQRFDPQLRERWYANGLRAGYVASALPPTLERWMKLTDRPTTAAGDLQQVDVAAAPRVSQRHLQLRKGQDSEIVASDLIETLPLFVVEAGEVRGRTYTNAQCLFALTCDARPDGQVELILVPQVHYGDPRQRWTASDGTFRLDSGRPHRDFGDLRLATALSPGQMLVLGTIAERHGSLGHHFLTRATEEKLIVIRLSQLGEGDLFGEPGDNDNVARTDLPPLAATAIIERPVGATATATDDPAD